MATSDYIAVGILAVCALLGMLGALKWVLRFLTGVAVGLIVLACIGLLSENPEFDRASRGVFRGGVVIPCMRTQIHSVGKLVTGEDDISSHTIAMDR